MHDKKNSFAVSNPPKCIANLRTQPNAFQDESWDLSNSKDYEFDRIDFKLNFIIN